MPPFLHQGRVAFHETDAAGIVHFANYFRYAEEAETHALADCGFAPHAHAWPRVHAEADYCRPLRFWEAYTVAAVLERIGNSSLTWRFDIADAYGRCATIRCTNARRTPQNEPAPFGETERRALEKLTETPPGGKNDGKFEKNEP